MSGRRRLDNRKFYSLKDFFESEASSIEDMIFVYNSAPEDLEKEENLK